MITDSCPCDHDNPDNQKWCCGDKTHLDLSHSAFGLIADHTKGVVDIKYTRLESCGAAEHHVHTQTCDMFERYHVMYHVADVCRALFGAAVAFAAAGAVLAYLVIGLWHKVRMSRMGSQEHLNCC